MGSGATYDVGHRNLKILRFAHRLACELRHRSARLGPAFVPILGIEMSSIPTGTRTGPGPV
jgi:hypothetical protein